jgi:predicted DNA-binding transcriptional regulator AlpA
MRDLERLTGVGRETIRYYIREGLLPEPERPSRNVAWYDQRFVERLALIKELQQKRFLPLHVIRRLVSGERIPPPAEIEALLQLGGKLLPTTPGGVAHEPQRVSVVAKRLGLPAGEVRDLAAVGLFEIETRAGDQWLGAVAVRMTELWARLRGAGFTPGLGFSPESLRVHVDMIRWLAREELQQFSRGIARRVDSDTSATMAEVGIDAINEMLGLLRRETLLRFVADGNVPEAGTPPSEQAS